MRQQRIPTPGSLRWGQPYTYSVVERSNHHGDRAGGDVSRYGQRHTVAQLESYDYYAGWMFLFGALVMVLGGALLAGWGGAFVAFGGALVSVGIGFSICVEMEKYTQWLLDK